MYGILYLKHMQIVHSCEQISIKVTDIAHVCTMNVLNQPDLSLFYVMLLFSSNAVGGMGFGVIAGVIAFSNVLKESGGPGIVGVNGGSQFFVLTSGMVHLYIGTF